MNKLGSFLLNQAIKKVCVNNCKSSVVLYSSNFSKKDEPIKLADGTKKPRISPKITLINVNDTVSVVSLDEATKLSKRRDLKLVKILDLDTKTSRSVYKLMSGTEYHTEELKRREEKKKTKQEQHIKGEKLLPISARITEHDLNSKLSTTVKWLQKLYEVRVVLTADSGDSQKSEKIIGNIESKIKDIGRIVQKRNKEGTLRFSILPIIKKDEDSNKTTDPTSSIDPVLELDTKDDDPENDTSPPSKINKIQARSYHTLAL